MQVVAREFYQALKGLGPVPKTFEIETITVLRDLQTGRSKKKTEKSKHAVVRIWDGHGDGVTVDFERLRNLTKNLGKTVIDVRRRDGFWLTAAYPGGEFTLVDFKTSPSAELDLKSIQLKTG